MTLPAFVADAGVAVAEGAGVGVGVDIASVAVGFSVGTATVSVAVGWTIEGACVSAVACDAGAFCVHPADMAAARITRIASAVIRETDFIP